MAASIQGIYVALFGRPADPAGLAYFNEATDNGANLDAIGDLAKTDEYQSRFANMTDEEIVNSIYKSLFERDGEKAGIDFYVGELAAGRLNINNIAIAILDGAKNDDLATVNAKIAAADIFTSHLDLNAEIEAYRGNTAAQIGRDYLDNITKDNPGTSQGADDTILKLLPDQGQQPGGGGGGGGGGGPSLEQRAEAIETEWRALDATYNDTPSVNEAFVRLGNKYVEYLNDGGNPLSDIAKEGEHRSQTLHDNLLSNLTEYAVRQRMAAHDSNPEKGYAEDLRSDAAKEFGLRPQNQGMTNDAGNHDALASAAWDLHHNPEWGVVDTKADFAEGKVYVVNWSEFEASPQTTTTPTVDVYNSIQEAITHLSDGDSVVFGKGQHQGAVQTTAEGVVFISAPDAEFIGSITSSQGHNIDIAGVNFVSHIDIAFKDANVASDHKFEPGTNLDTLIQDLVSDGRISQTDFKLLSDLSSKEDAIKMFWDYVDDHYSYYNESINSVGVDLGIIYAKHLLEGGRALTENVVKYTPGADESHPARLQTMHDNLLGNLDENSILDKFGDTSPEDHFPNLYSAENILGRIDGAGLGEFIGDLGNYNDGRPIYSGNAGVDPAPTRDWDADFFGWSQA